jgi:4'-phosphopantetheinyl transferase
MRKGISNLISVGFNLPHKNAHSASMDPETAKTRDLEVWLISCGSSPGNDCSGELLSPDERERADCFRRDLDRKRFRVVHTAMRMILAEYLNVGPREVLFSSAKGMKPEFDSRFSGAGIQFNLSHSSELALLAVARGARVGVDIEWMKPEFPIDEIAARFFSAAEISVLKTLPADERVEAFFSCWTRKEAYIKARGEGLSLALDSFDVAFGSKRAVALVQVRDNPGEVSRWSMYDLNVPKGYKAALVAEGKAHCLRQFEWPRHSRSK